MNLNESRPRGLKLFIAGALGALLTPITASAFFPPLNHYPYPNPIQSPPVVMPPVVAPPPVVPPAGQDPIPPIVTPRGDPEEPGTPPVTPPVAATPEPATIVTGLVGLGLLGGWSLRRRRAKHG